MAPLPDPSLQSSLRKLVSAISSFFKSNPDLSPLSITDPVEVATVQITGWEAPSLVPTTSTSSKLPVPTKTETWSEITGPQNPDGFVEYVSDRWSNTHKRSVEAEEPLIAAMDRASSNVGIPQQPEGEFHDSYPQELWFLIFIFFAFSLMATAAMLFLTKVAKRVSCRIARCLMELGGDHRM